MLVLSRRAKERIQIGDNVVITVLEIRGRKVRLGFDAPQEIPVLREELRDAIAPPPTGRHTAAASI
jgi:carbon storage regulator